MDGKGFVEQGEGVGRAPGGEEGFGLGEFGGFGPVEPDDVGDGQADLAGAFAAEVEGESHGVADDARGGERGGAAVGERERLAGGERREGGEEKGEEDARRGHDAGSCSRRWRATAASGRFSTRGLRSISR